MSYVHEAGESRVRDMRTDVAVTAHIGQWWGRPGTVLLSMAAVAMS